MSLQRNSWALSECSGQTLKSPCVGVLSLHLYAKCSAHLCRWTRQRKGKSWEDRGKQEKEVHFLKGRIILWGRHQCLDGIYSWLCHRLALWPHGRPFNSLTLLVRVGFFSIFAMWWWQKHATSTNEELKYSLLSFPIKLLLMLSSSSSFTGETVTCPCLWKVGRGCALSPFSCHETPWYCLEGSWAEWKDGSSPPRLSAGPSLS